MRNVSLAVDLEQSLLSNNTCQMPMNELINMTDDSDGHLSFCDVEIKGLPGCVHALDDSGTQLSLVNTKVIDTLNLPRFGKVVVRGALGDPVCALLVNLQQRLCHENVGWSKLLSTPLHQRVLGRHCAMG